MTEILSQLRDAGGMIGLILAAMAAVSVLETWIPLQAKSRWYRAHLVPNLTLTFITFATNIVMNTLLVLALVWMHVRGLGLLAMLALPAVVEVALVVVILDFSFYVAHVAMHKLPSFWQFHRVHHSDPAVDVTTTIRQHPGESLIRYVFLTVFAIGIGATPVAFAVYRLLSVLNALLEHASFRLPSWLDRALSWVTTWPSVHKIHHSPNPKETDSNYGNLLSIWDRLFGTFMPASERSAFTYGLEGTDVPALQSTTGLLSWPFRREREPR